MSLTIRNALLLVLVVFTICMASTLTWVTARYNQFARESLFDISAHLTEGVILLQLDRYRSHVVDPFAAGWANINTLVHGVTEENTKKLTVAVDRMFATLEVKNGLIDLREVAVYGPDMELLLTSSRGTGEHAGERPGVIEELRSRPTSEKRLGLDAIWQTNQGRPVLSVIKAIGGFRLLGFIEFVVDPVVGLTSVSDAIGGTFTLQDNRGNVLIQNEHSEVNAGQEDANRETASFVIPGTAGEPWARATVDIDVHALEFASDELHEQAIAIIIVISALTLVICLFIVRHLVFDRINRLTSLLRSLSHGDTSFELEAETDDFGGMREAIEVLRDTVDHHHELQDQLESELDERRVMTQQLRLSMIQANAANRAKSDFLASMSHELRTPLNAILGFAEMIRSEALGKIGEPRYTEYANDINSSGSHLLSIINDVLDLSKVEAGKWEVEASRFDLAEAIAESVRLVNFTSGRDASDVKIEIAPGVTDLWADARSFRQIMINLISNADKYTSGDGTISVAAYLDEQRNIIVSVSDDGVGIAAKDIKRVLEPFGQARGEIEIAHQGTGLGLPLAAHLMELNGGSLSLDSEPGRGTTVTLKFPDAADVAALSA